jgi:aryl-alcohol dehydrogenase-like predicted oxidoreductase
VLDHCAANGIGFIPFFPLAGGNLAKPGPSSTASPRKPVWVRVKSRNFVRIHQTLMVTPATAAGVTKRLWEMGDIVDVLEAWEAI